jgi:hypothetical protein
MLSTEMESSAFVPSRLKGGMCPADDVTPQRRKPSFDRILNQDVQNADVKVAARRGRKRQIVACPRTR